MSGRDIITVVGAVTLLSAAFAGIICLTAAIDMRWPHQCDAHAVVLKGSAGDCDVTTP